MTLHCPQSTGVMQRRLLLLCWISFFFLPPLLCPSLFFSLFFSREDFHGVPLNHCPCFKGIAVRKRMEGRRRKTETRAGATQNRFLPSLANICRRDEEAAARLFGETKQFNFGKISYPHLLAAVNCVLNSNAHARGKTKKRKKDKNPHLCYMTLIRAQ